MTDTLKIEIEMGNAAFEGVQREFELSRILRTLADRLEDHGIGMPELNGVGYGAYVSLYDVNGNKVGRMDLVKGE